MKHEPEGVDRACDCIGYENVDAHGKEGGSQVLTQAIHLVRQGGGIGVIGVYLPTDLRKSFILPSMSQVLIRAQAAPPQL